MKTTYPHGDGARQNMWQWESFYIVTGPTDESQDVARAARCIPIFRPTSEARPIGLVRSPQWSGKSPQ